MQTARVITNNCVRLPLPTKIIFNTKTNLIMSCVRGLLNGFSSNAVLRYKESWYMMLPIISKTVTTVVRVIF